MRTVPWSRSIGIEGLVQQRILDLLIKFLGKGCAGDNLVQEAFGEVAQQGLSVKEGSAVRAIQTGGADAWHSRYIVLDGLFIRIGEHLPAVVQLKIGARLRPLALARRSDDLTILEGRDVLVFRDNALNGLRVLIPEQEVGPWLEILRRVEGHEMDVVQRSNDIMHTVATDLPGEQLKLYRLLLIGVAQQLERGSRFAASCGQQKIFRRQRAHHDFRRDLAQTQLLMQKLRQCHLCQMPGVNILPLFARSGNRRIRLYPQVESSSLHKVLCVFGNPCPVYNMHARLPWRAIHRAHPVSFSFKQFHTTALHSSWSMRYFIIARYGK